MPRSVTNCTECGDVVDITWRKGDSLPELDVCEKHQIDALSELIIDWCENCVVEVNHMVIDSRTTIKTPEDMIRYIKKVYVKKTKEVKK